MNVVRSCMISQISVLMQSRMSLRTVVTRKCTYILGLALLCLCVHYIISIAICIDSTMCYLKYTGTELHDLRPTQKAQLLNTVYKNIHDLGCAKRIRGTSAGIRKKQLISVHTGQGYLQPPKHGQMGINVDNLHVIDHPQHIQVNITSRKYEPKKGGVSLDNLNCIVEPSADPVPVKFGCVNARSVRNKSLELCEYIKDQNLDILAITETWLFSHDLAIIRKLTPNGYNLKHEPRNDRQGGGVAIIYREGIKCEGRPSIQPTTFEHMVYKFTSHVKSMTLAVLYRPTHSEKNNKPMSLFFDELTDLLENLSTSVDELLVVGDFNIHVDNKLNRDAIHLLDLLDSFNLIQHVNEPTHKDGHTLDLIITRPGNFITNLTVDSLISDHFSVLCHLPLPRPPQEKKEFSYRKYSSIDMVSFQSDLVKAVEETVLIENVDSLVSEFSDKIKTIVNNHAPLLKKSVIVRPNCPWMTEDIRSEKQIKRQTERKWRSSKTGSNLKAYQDQKNKVNCLLQDAHTQYFSEIVVKNSSNPRGLFKVVNSLMGKKTDNPLPPHTSPTDLANDFASFFDEKIVKIQMHLDNQTVTSQKDTSPVDHSLVCQFNEFLPLTEEEVCNLIAKAPNKTCELDPIATGLLKECKNELSPIIMRIINMSFDSASFPTQYKLAFLLPLLKKLGLDLIKNNFRPVSNLEFLSKLTERAAASQFLSHVKINKLQEPFQSAYCEGRSTETALVRVKNDHLLALDGQQIVMQILLDLSAAFDTINHSQLLQRLDSRFGVTGKALRWFESYLTGRSQIVRIGDSSSRPVPLSCGVPQGSVLGPLLFTCYVSPLSDVIREHGLSYHVYADDTQLYLSFRPSGNAHELALEKLEACIKDVSDWMVANRLKLNGDKTEFLLLGTARQLSKIPPLHINVGSSLIAPSDKVRNLGCIFDTHMSMKLHVNAICKSAYHFLHNIRMIRKYLTVEATKTAVQAFVISRLDCNNALLFGLPCYLVKRLQRVQNMAARLITNTRKYDHITPVLLELHWLPISCRISFKMLVLVYKSVHGLAPEYLSSLLKPYKPVRSLRSATNNNHLLVEPSARLVSYGDCAFSVAGPVLWNRLPDKLRTCNSVKSFKAELKTYMFKQHFNV